MREYNEKYYMVDNCADDCKAFLCRQVDEYGLSPKEKDLVFYKVRKFINYILNDANDTELECELNKLKGVVK